LLGAAVRTEWLDNDYYHQLGVPDTASDAEIRAACRRLARRFHPDANPRSSDAEARFKQITAAYHVLGDPVRRQQYDDLRRAAALPASVVGPPAGPAGGARRRGRSLTRRGSALLSLQAAHRPGAARNGAETSKPS
jgi:molecular chaperone DnaJ